MQGQLHSFWSAVGDRQVTQPSLDWSSQPHSSLQRKLRLQSASAQQHGLWTSACCQQEQDNVRVGIM